MILSIIKNKGKLRKEGFSEFKEYDLLKMLLSGDGEDQLVDCMKVTELTLCVLRDFLLLL